jgi:cytochrome oxidase assembly protein ShyY1
MGHYKLRFKIGQYQFKSGAYFFLLILSSIVLCAVLAAWQWQRGNTANDRYLRLQTNTHLPAVPLPNSLEHFKRVELSGEIVAYYLLDNRSNSHRAGREVLTEVPLKREDLPYDRALINIGWQPYTRELVPTHPLPERISIEGILIFPEPGFLLQNPTLDPKWPHLLQHVDIELLGFHKNLRYYPAVIYSLTPTSLWATSDISVKNKYHMHMAYALQWALIGIAFLLLFIKISTSKVHDDIHKKLAT